MRNGEKMDNHQRCNMGVHILPHQIAAPAAEAQKCTEIMGVHVFWACATANPKVTMNNPRLMAGQMAALMSQERSAARVLTVFGSLALLLAAIGLYGIISYSVTQRAHEFGIRMALGAQNGDILRHVIWEGMILVALGMAIGLPCCLALSRLVGSRLHGLSPLDPVVYVMVPVLSFAVTLCAVVPPARRAIAHPMNALRVE